MAKRKRVQPKRKLPQDSAEVNEQSRINLTLKKIEQLEKDGIYLEPVEPITDPLLKELESICSVEEMKILEHSGAFGAVKLKLTPEGDEYVRTKTVAEYNSREPPMRPQPPCVPIFGEKINKSGSFALGQELRYLCTVLQPAEMRWLVAELTCDLLEQAPVTHTDISDAVIASIAPSTAQKIAFQADAQYKYTTAQFLQVYLKMRHIVLEHKILLQSAKVDSMLLAASKYCDEIPDLQLPDDMNVPISAVNALRNIIDEENDFVEN